jgi:succinate dehydrogenase/fumarate reductase flavoprotein subunit
MPDTLPGHDCDVIVIGSGFGGALTTMRNQIRHS